jgi:tRNA-uridine 2-sulfurtransferase
MKNWDEDDGTEYCTARRIWPTPSGSASELDIPLHTANFAAEYWDNVFEHFLAEYAAGRTPNPTCCATGRSSSSSSPTTPLPSAPT